MWLGRPIGRLSRRAVAIRADAIIAPDAMRILTGSASGHEDESVMVAPSVSCKGTIARLIRKAARKRGPSEHRACSDHA